MSGSVWEIDGLARACGGEWVSRPTRAMRGATVDSRRVREGQVFFALRGARADGHGFVGDAWSRGASAAVVERTVEAPEGMGLLRVADVLGALAGAARAHRDRLGGAVVAVAGANGKTTTKRLIDGVLGRAMGGSASPRSFNNAIGVPLTLLNAREDDGYVVCEVGTSGIGETAALGEIVRPDVAVLTGSGCEHLEGLGSEEGSAREALSLCAYLRPGGVAVVNGDDGRLAGAVAGRVVRFGAGGGADVRYEVVRHGLSGLRVRVGGEEYATMLIGRHNAGNVAAAVAVGRLLGVDAGAIREGIAGVGPADGRLEVREVEGVVVIDDSYNANPDSVRAAVATLVEVARGRAVAVLGDMLELGDRSAALHAEVGAWLAPIDALGYVVLVGERMRSAMEALAPVWRVGRVEWLPDAAEPFASRIAAQVRSGDTVLVKGSRGMRMERVVDRLSGRAVGV